MKRVILFGGTGKLGRQVAKELRRKDYFVTAVVRNKTKVIDLELIVNQTVIANVTNPHELKNICDGFEIVVSTLGKSVSPNDRSKEGFTEIDLHANLSILREAITSNVKKFVYVSAFGAENHPNLAYFNTHHLVSEQIIKSEIDYSIIKPVAIFSSFIDIIEMAKKGHSVVFGAGDKLTNPVYEADLAEICVKSIDEKNAIIEVGGETVYSRKQICDLIQEHIAPHKKVRKVPFGLLKFGLPFLKIFDRNAYDKFSFFAEVLQHETIAPKLGKTTLENYLQEKLFDLAGEK